MAQLGARFHGMEEVVGSIPTRSTNPINNLARANDRRLGSVSWVCVMTPDSGALGEGFEGLALGFHADVTVPLQHPTAAFAVMAHFGEAQLQPRYQPPVDFGCFDQRNATRL